jgi:hypothetical protein
MLNIFRFYCRGSNVPVTWPDKWTAVTADGLPSAQFEHTLLITETGDLTYIALIHPELFLLKLAFHLLINTASVFRSGRVDRKAADFAKVFVGSVNLTLVIHRCISFFDSFSIIYVSKKVKRKDWFETSNCFYSSDY